MARGNELVKEGKLNEATIEYRNALKVDPYDGQVEVVLGNAYHALGDYPRASKSYARAADLLPDDIEVQIKAGSLRLLAQTIWTRGRSPSASSSVNPGTSSLSC